MLPVYDAIEFVKLMDGGSTRPWLINVLVAGKPESYVVKLYTEKNNDENNTVLKECICSTLATKFDIDTPSPALINFTPEFINEGLSKEIRDELFNKDTRLKFATKLIRSGYENFSPQLSAKYLKHFDLATIYAFDNLILNVDRRTDKPNLFFRDSRAVVIDHELTLKTGANAIKDLANKKWTHYYSRHIFFDYLKTVNTENGQFDTFLTYLENLVKFNDLQRIYDQLEECGHPIDQFFVIRDYFSAIKQSPQAFIRLIEETIA